MRNAAEEKSPVLPSAVSAGSSYTYLLIGQSLTYQWVRVKDFRETDAGQAGG